MAAIVRVSVLRKSKRFLFLLLSSKLNCHRFASSYWLMPLFGDWIMLIKLAGLSTDWKREEVFSSSSLRGESDVCPNPQAIMQYEENFAPNEISTNGDVKIPPPLLIPTRIPQYNQ